MPKSSNASFADIKEPTTAVVQAVPDAPPMVAPVLTPMQMIAEASRNPDIDPAKMHALMDLHERVENRRAEQEYARAMVACQIEMPTVVKDAENSDNGARYAKLETIQKAIKPIYQKHGFALSLGEDKSEKVGWLRVKCIVRHIGGHTEIFYREGPVDNKGPKGGATKTELHGTQSAVTYMYRNLLCSIFGITVAGQDNDGGGKRAEVITDAQKKQVHDLLVDTKSDPAGFLEYFRIDDLALMTQGPMLNEAMRLLLAKKRKAGGT